MTYPGLPFGLMIAVAIGTAIYYYFRNENTAQSYDNNVYYDMSRPATRSSGDGETRARRKRKKPNAEQEYCRDSCSICFDKLKTSNTRRLSCDHEYHAKCINQWLYVNRSCPLCRSKVQ